MIIKKWYIIHTFSGRELDVKNFLQEKIEQNNYRDFFGEILIPVKNTLETKFGKNKTIKRKMFPGYMLIEMTMTDDLWHFVKNIPHVFGFICDDSGVPLFINDDEADLILEKTKENKSLPKVLVKPGEMIKIIDGPFIDLNAMVEETNYEKNKLCVSVLIFGRPTPLDLNFSQIEKI